MTPALRTAILALLVTAPAVLAQSLFFGEPVPQTHTRYGAWGADPRMATNGNDVFLFWATESKLRVTRLVPGQNRAGRPVLSGKIVRFDVVWTGTHFLVAGDQENPDGSHQIVGRLLNANGETVAAAFPILQNGRAPALASDGARVLMTYDTGAEIHSVVLRTDGILATDPRTQTIAPAGVLETAVVKGGPGFVAASAYDNMVRVTRMDAASTLVAASQIGATPVPQRRVAVASNGSTVLVVWTNGNNLAECITVRPDGTMYGNKTIAGTAGAVDVAASWNGAKWVVSVSTNGKLQTRFVDDASDVEAHTAIKAHELSTVSVASLNGRTYTAWRGTSAGQPVLLRELAGSGNGADAAFAAAEQTLQTATSSHDGALAVWSEVRDGRQTLYAGIRGIDGSWRENRIGGDESAPLASSDGSLFLVIKQADNGWSAVTLSNTAQILASTGIVKTFKPTSITWDGTAWVVIGLSGTKRIYAARVTPAGIVSNPVVIQELTNEHEIENPRIAAGGGGFLAVWQESDFEICFPVCDPYFSVLRGTRLTPTLQRVDTLDIEIAADEAVSPDLFWDGSRFAIFWLDGGALETRTLRPDAGGSGTTRIDGAQIDTEHIRATLTPFGTTITSNDGEVLLIRSNDLITRYSLGNPNSPDALVILGPDVAYLQAQQRDEMPYHGASHLFLRTGGVLPRDTMPLPPEIIRAQMTDGGNLMVIEWRPPIDSINGYRIEYRVDDGTWNEFDEWINDASTSVSIVPWLDGVRYQFRLRAWSDAGVSEYSMPATVRLLGRRRAVR